MPYFASNNGLTVQWHDPAEGYQPKPGESNMGIAYPTPVQLETAFPGYQEALTALLHPFDVTANYVARLNGKATLLQRQGKTAEAAALFIKAVGERING